MDNAEYAQIGTTSTVNGNAQTCQHYVATTTKTTGSALHATPAMHWRMESAFDKLIGLYVWSILIPAIGITALNVIMAMSSMPKTANATTTRVAALGGV